jgi:hypothetical protein
MRTLIDLSRTCPRPARLALAALLLVAASARAGDDDKIKEGQWTKHDIPKGWVLVETPHYQIQSSLDAATSKKLGDCLESMLKLYSDFMPTRRKLSTFVLKVFPSKAAFCTYSGYKPDTPVVAYYNQGTQELVGYDCGYIFGKRTTPPQLHLKPGTGSGGLTDPQRQQVNDLLVAASNAYTFDLVRVLAHEGWHQYFHFYTVSWVPMPAWLDEGVGDYFFMAAKDMQDGNLPGFELGRINIHRLRRMRRGLEDGTFTPFEQFMDFDQAAYYQNGSLNYAQGWSMVHFLLQNKDPKRRELIPKLIRDFKDSKNFRKSTDKVFAGEKYDQLNKDWLGWLLEQTVEDPLLTLARQFGDKVAPKDIDGEKNLLDVYKWYLDHPDYPKGQAPIPPAATPPSAGPPVLGPPTGGTADPPPPPDAGKPAGSDPAKP